MNKYELKGGSGLSREEQAAGRELTQVFKEVREIILNNKNYALGAARDIIAKLSDADAKKLYEMFNFEEGALPNELETEYIKLAYSKESLENKMKEGKTYFEALSAIAWEIKNAHIELNSDLVQERVKLSLKEISIE